MRKSVAEKSHKKFPAPVFNEVIRIVSPRSKPRKSSTGKKPDGSTNITVTILVDPCPAPRMTQRDRWYTDPEHPNPRKRQRPRVTKYLQFKEVVVAACAKAGWKLGPCLSVAFHIPMPPSWKKKDREAMNGQLHRQRPDIDNLCKAVMDAFGADDGHVATIVATKRWSEEGSIVLS